jgi:hypothetical protein
VYVFQLNLGTQIYYYKVAIFARNNSLTFFLWEQTIPKFFLTFHLFLMKQ